MKKQLKIIINVLKRKSYFSLFLLSGLGYGLIYAILANLIDIRLGLDNINISFTRISALFFILFSLLGGILITLQAFAVRNKQKSVSSANVGFFGAFLSFFTTTCPFCKPLLLSFIGFSGSLVLLKYGLLLAIVSLALLVISIYLATLNLSKLREFEKKDNKK